MTAATHAQRSHLLVFATLGAIVFCYLFLDQPIATFSHDVLQRPAWCVWLTWIADVPLPGATLILLAAGIAWLAGWRPGPVGRLVLIACVATLAAQALKDELKFAFGRPWPETWTNKNPSWIGTHTYGFFPFHGGQGYAAFPSGHTTLVSAPCAILWRHMPRLRPVWAGLPALVVLGLLGSDYHFLSDCLAGGLVGVACALATDGLAGRHAPASRPAA